MSQPWIPADWPAAEQIIAGTTLRDGGASSGKFRSFNLADHVGDDPVAVADNRARLQELAALFHSYYNRQKVLVDDLPTARARLYLVQCVRIVLANALQILGVSAPESM